MVKRRLDKLVVVDLEATCWNDDAIRVSEIIEFGLCFYDIKKEEISDKRSFYVNTRKTEVSPFCTELTGITQGILDRRGIPYEAAVNKIIQIYGTPSRTWVSWGAYDRIKIEDECRIMNVRYPFSVRHINLKTEFAIKFKLSKEKGLKKALSKVGLEFEGQQHCGADDAYNTARLIPYVLGDKK